MNNFVCCIAYLFYKVKKKAKPKQIPLLFGLVHSAKLGDREKLHSFANVGLWVSYCNLHMCTMCIGFLNCLKGQKQVGKNKIFPVSQFLIIYFYSRFNIFNLQKSRNGLHLFDLQIFRLFFLYFISDSFFIFQVDFCSFSLYRKLRI